MGSPKRTSQEPRPFCECRGVEPDLALLDAQPPRACDVDRYAAGSPHNTLIRHARAEATAKPLARFRRLLDRLLSHG